MLANGSTSRELLRFCGKTPDTGGGNWVGYLHAGMHDFMAFLSQTMQPVYKAQPPLTTNDDKLPSLYYTITFLHTVLLHIQLLASRGSITKPQPSLNQKSSARSVLIEKH